MKIFILTVALAIASVILVEGSLRFLLGLGNPPLYQADDEIGYLLAPQQRLRRLGRLIEINQYSLRNAAILVQRPDTTLRILLLGDSIANGGWWTDQTQTLSSLIGAQLMHQLTTEPAKTGATLQLTTSLPESLITPSTLSFPIQSVEVLNASANSWGPRNQLAYLQRFGTFNAQVILLLLNTDDLFATRPTPLPVGRDPNYPERKPPFALVELYQHFRPASSDIPELAEIKQEKGDRVGQNLAAIQAMQGIATQANAQFAIAITPLRREVLDGSRDYEQLARQRLQLLSQTQQIPYHDFLPPFRAQAQPQELYRDSIHLSPSGNRLVSQHLSHWLIHP